MPDSQPAVNSDKVDMRLETAMLVNLMSLILDTARERWKRIELGMKHGQDSYSSARRQESDVNVKRLLDFIASIESCGNYNAVYGNAGSTHDLSQYTLAEIHSLQYKHGRKTGSSAYGRYQFIRKTLLSLRKTLGLSATQKFTPELQDRMATQLLKQRGLDRWVAGSMSDSEFMDSLSKEWASLPHKTGRSYYDGDGMNHALASRDEFRAVLEQVPHG